MDKNVMHNLEVALSNGVKKTWFEKFPFFTVGFLSLVLTFACVVASSGVKEMLMFSVVAFVGFLICMVCTVIKAKTLQVKLFG